MNAHGARHLREARDRLFHVAGIEHHQIGQLVDDDDDVRNRLFVPRFVEQAGRAILIEQAVVLVDVPDAFGGEQFQAALHFADRVAQRIGREFRLGDDGRVKMRNAFVVAQFQTLGVHQNQAHLIGRGLVQDRHDHRVDGDALARAGGTGDQQMRHSGEIGGDDAAVDVFAHGDRHL